MSLEKIAGVKLNVHCTGSGEPTLIFVHGLACDALDFRPQAAALSPRFRVVTFDLPGHGESESGDGAIEALAGIVSRLKTLYGRGHVILAGHSLGCFVILEALRQSSAGIDGLVFMDGGRVAQGDASTAVNAFKMRLDAVGVGRFTSAVYQHMFVPGSDPQLKESVLARAKHLEGTLAEQMMLSAVRWDAAEAASALAGVKVPVLVLQSTYLDEQYTCQSLKPGMTTPWTQLVAQHVPGAKVHVVPGVGHFLMTEAAHLVNDHIGAFARSLAIGTPDGRGHQWSSN